jgi:hypothetical protein
MEEEMDKLIKEKEQSVQMAMIPLEEVPLIGIRQQKHLHQQIFHQQSQYKFYMH